MVPATSPSPGANSDSDRAPPSRRKRRAADRVRMARTSRSDEKDRKMERVAGKISGIATTRSSLGGVGHVVTNRGLRWCLSGHVNCHCTDEDGHKRGAGREHRRRQDLQGGPPVGEKGEGPGVVMTSASPVAHVKRQRVEDPIGNARLLSASRAPCSGRGKPAGENIE